MGIPFVAFNAPGPQGPVGPQGPRGDIGPQGPAGSVINVSGTGFVHWSGTATAPDPLARAINLASSDVTGLLAVSGIVPGTNGQLLSTVGGASGWVNASSVVTGNVTPGTPGQVYITNNSTVSAWTSLVVVELAHGRFTSGGGGSDFAILIGAAPGFETVESGVWALANGVAASSSNYLALGDGQNAYFNAIISGGTISFRFANANAAHLTTTILTLDTAATIQWAAGVTSPTVTQLAATSDVATTNLKIQGQYAFASATGTHSIPGNIILDIGAPTNSGTTEARVEVSRNATVVAALGIAQNSLPTYGALWLGTTNIGASTNWAIRSDGVGSTYVNAESLGALGFLTAGSNFQLYISGSIAYWGGSTISAPVQINWSTSITPLIQSGSSATSLTVGTSKASAALILQGDAAATILTLTTQAELATQLLIDGVSAPSAPASGKAVLYVDSNDGKLKVKLPSGNVYALSGT